MSKTTRAVLVALLVVFSVMNAASIVRADEPYVSVDVTVDCGNVDTSSVRPAREPVQQDWYGSYDDSIYAEVPQGGNPHVAIIVSDLFTGEHLGTIEVGGRSSLPTKGYHDNWFSSDTSIDGRHILAVAYVDGVEVDRDDEVCPEPLAPVVTDPAPTPPLPTVSRPGTVRPVALVRLYTPRPL